MLKLQRNGLCWCGSGKKYKNCHLKSDQMLEHLEDEGYFILPRDTVKNEQEIEGIRKSARITKEILDLVQDKIKPGITTNEIDKLVYDYTIKNNAIPAPLNYAGFPKSVCTSINNVICHGIPDETVLKDGDIVNVDVSTILDGYYSDASRMYIAGEGSEGAKRLVQATKECLEAGIEQVKPFKSLNLVGDAIQKVADSYGYSIVRDYCGHGVGIEFHEEPQVDHYRKNDPDDKGVIMVPGMVFTIEPMINEGSYRTKVLEDGWTAVTTDGKLSAQWEHTILVTWDGYEILTA